MKDVLFIDIETNRKGEISDYGALFNGQELHEKHTTRLETWIKEATIICGHNIIAHDIPELKKILGDQLFEGKKYIDTLLWSPLIFSENPYHHLVKGYKIVNDTDANNPLSDCKLTKELLMDELVGFKNLDESYRNSLTTLLASSDDYNCFLELGGFTQVDSEPAELVYLLLQNKICRSADLKRLIEQHPVEMAYALAILRLDNNESILPYWVQHQFPDSEKILET